MSRILIPNKKNFETKLQNIIAWWPENFHVITDFDRTLTKAFVDGKKNTALISIIQEKWYLWTDFTEQSRKNFEKYHPIEIDPNISLEEKKKAMYEWWNGQNNLLVQSWLTRDIIKEVVLWETIDFRKWYKIFFDILQKNAIPLLIFSASGIWYDGIYYSLEKVWKLSDTIHIISNAFIRDETGKAMWVKAPIIHSFNKDENIIKNFPIYKKIKDRIKSSWAGKNILLLGDGIWDIQMADGFEYENIIKIWFLNNDTPQNRKKFSEAYDLIILGDWTLDEVNEVLKKMLSV